MAAAVKLLRTRALAPGVALFLALAASAPAAGQRLDIERAGDVIMRAFPIGTLGASLALGDYDGSEQFLLGFALTAGVTEGLKMLVHKPRPDGSDGESFPSGHTSIAFHSAAFIHLRYGAEYGVPAYAAAALVGYSRVHARKHFIEDALVGTVIGVVSALLLTDERVSAEDEARAARVDFGVRADFGSGLATKLTAGLLGITP